MLRTMPDGEAGKNSPEQAAFVATVGQLDLAPNVKRRGEHVLWPLALAWNVKSRESSLVKSEWKKRQDPRTSYFTQARVETPSMDVILMLHVHVELAFLRGRLLDLSGSRLTMIDLECLYEGVCLTGSWLDNS